MTYRWGQPSCPQLLPASALGTLCPASAVLCLMVCFLTSTRHRMSPDPQRSLHSVLVSLKGSGVP